MIYKASKILYLFAHTNYITNKLTEIECVIIFHKFTRVPEKLAVV